MGTDDGRSVQESRNLNEQAISLISQAKSSGDVDATRLKPEVPVMTAQRPEWHMSIAAWTLVHLLLFPMAGLFLATVKAQLRWFSTRSLHHDGMDGGIACSATILLVGAQLPAISSRTTAHSECAKPSRRHRKIGLEYPRTFGLRIKTIQTIKWGTRSSSHIVRDTPW